jgi:hypothetical protein
VRNTDVLPAVIIRFLPSEDLDDFRHFAGSNEKVHLGQFVGQFLRIPLGKATGDDQLLDLSFLFEPRDFNDGIDRLGFGSIDETASVNQHNIRIRRFVHHLVLVLLQQTRHDLRINQISGATQTHDTEFLLARTH